MKAFNIEELRQRGETPPAARGVRLHRRRRGGRAHAAGESRGFREGSSCSEEFWSVFRRSIQRPPFSGKPAKLPIAIAPTGAVGFGWRGGDVAVAKAAAAFGIPFSLSTSATASIERIAEEAPGRHWFQAYFFKDREYTFGLIERARKAGYDTLMVTADLPVGGKRERDFRNDFSHPVPLHAEERARLRHAPGLGAGHAAARRAAAGESRRHGGPRRRHPQHRVLGRPQPGRRRSTGRSSSACAASGRASC